jgi:hypothetical protein
LVRRLRLSAGERYNARNVLVLADAAQVGAPAVKLSFAPL